MIEENKKILSEALKNSFVDDYPSYKKIIDNINNDFEELKIDFKWSYDQFCVDFLNESMKKIEEVDIFRYKNFEDFYMNFWNFNLIIVRTILLNKFEELGYDYKKIKKDFNTQYYYDDFTRKN